MPTKPVPETRLWLPGDPPPGSGPVTAVVPATAEQAQKMMAIRTVYEANPSPELKAAMDVADSDDSALDALYEKVVGEA
jgi:hypothetical protein